MVNPYQCYFKQLYLLVDPEGILRGCFVRDRRGCNAQVLVYERLLQDVPTDWRVLAERLGVPFGTVTSFYNRRVSPLLREFVGDRFPDLRDN